MGRAAGGGNDGVGGADGERNRAGPGVQRMVLVVRQIGAGAAPLERFSGALFLSRASIRRRRR